MAGISGQGTTYNLPNYTNELFQVSPEDTPFLSAIGGLTGGEQTTSPQFGWQTEDLRDAEENRSRLEGANAQTADNRVRARVDNVVEIHQETVDVSYTKQAAIGQIADAKISGTNPVTAELPHQLMLALKAKARDVELSFILGRKQVPSNNTTPRKTGGLIEAITTNVIDLGQSFTGLSTSTDTIAQTATTLADGDAVRFTSVGASTTVKLDRVYYVVSKTTDAFKVSATRGGTPIVIGTATVAISALAENTDVPTKDDYDELFQAVFDNGGLAEGETATIMVGSRQKRSLSTVYAKEFGQYQEGSRTVAGVNFTTVLTDFGTMNIVLDRWMPADSFAVVSLEQCSPVFLEIPGKGHFFEEPLAKIGASDRVQIYGEIGLKWGNEKAHGIIRGLPVAPVWS